MGGLVSKVAVLEPAEIPLILITRLSRNTIFDTESSECHQVICNTALGFGSTEVQSQLHGMFNISMKPPG